MIQRKRINFSFTKRNRLYLQKDFNKVFKEGKRIRSENFQLIVLQKTRGLNRLAIKISKKIGKASKRNKIKRIIRELFRLNQHNFKEPIDIIINPYNSIIGKSFKEVEEEFKKSLEDYLIK